MRPTLDRLLSHGPRGLDLKGEQVEVISDGACAHALKDRTFGEPARAIRGD